METLTLYAIKVVLISALFYGYYYFVLRNKSFHYYNRFYLLASILLAIVLPLVPFEALFSGTSNVPDVVRYDYVGQIVTLPETATGFWNHDTILTMTYAVISAGLMTLFLFSLLKLSFIKKRGIKKPFKDYTLIKTRSKGTPYSFFRDVFWDPMIDVESTEGAGMLRHELVHIKQHHSADKLAMNLVQIIFWFNPVFWMMKRELYMIHEFLADKEAFGEDGAADFSKIALSSAYPGYTWPANNNFFHKPIKRRLIMLLKNNQQKATYWGRVLALPLVLLIAVFFSFKANAEKDIKINNSEKMNSAVILDTVPGRKDLKHVTIRPNQEKTPVLVEWNNGKKDSMSVSEAKKQGIPLPPPPPPAPPVPGTGSKYDNVNVYMPKGEDAYITFTRDNGKKDSLSMSEAAKLGIQLPSPPPPVKGQISDAVFSYKGNDGKSRVVIINNGSTEILTPEEAKMRGIKESAMKAISNKTRTIDGTESLLPDKDERVVVVTGWKKNPGENILDSTTIIRNGGEPIYLLDGKKISAAEMNNIPPDDIQSISVFKDEAATSLWGENAKNGVIMIELKK